MPLESTGHISYNLTEQLLAGQKDGNVCQSSKITADGDCSHEARYLLLGRKAMTNLDSILKSRDFTLPTKVRLLKAVVFPVVMFGCERDHKES